MLVLKQLYSLQLLWNCHWLMDNCSYCYWIFFLGIQLL